MKVKQAAVAALFLYILMGIFSETAYAESPFMKQGVAAFNAGDYNAAVGAFGAAESSDFNEPILHYYLANSLVRLKQKEAAIREYRIAYALEPDGEVGTLSKLALDILQVDAHSMGRNTNNKDSGSSLRAVAAPTLDPILQRTLDFLHQEAEQVKTGMNQRNQNDTNDLMKRRDAESQLLRRRTEDSIGDLSNSGPRRMHQSQQDILNDSRMRMEALRKDYENARQVYMERSNRQTSQLSESAANLETLLTEKTRPGKVKLSPQGTNLYVRNYEQVAEPGTSTSKSETESAAKPIPLVKQ